MSKSNTLKPILYLGLFIDYIMNQRKLSRNFENFLKNLTNDLCWGGLLANPAGLVSDSPQMLNIMNL